MTRQTTQETTMHGETDSGQVAAFAASSAVAGRSAAAQPPPSHATATRAYFAVEAPALSRALAGVRTTARTQPADLSITGRAMAGFVGLRARPDATPPAAPCLERLIHALDDELWFLGGTPAWVASGVLVPLGADPDEAAALTEGVPLPSRGDLAAMLGADGRGEWADADAADAATPAGPNPPEGAPTGWGTDPDAFSGLTVLDATHAPAWRAMLRTVASRYEQADDQLLRWLAVLGDVSTREGVDRLVYGVLASLTAVVDFAGNGQEVLIATPPAVEPRMVL